MVDADDDGGVRRRALSPILGIDHFRPLSATRQGRGRRADAPRQGAARSTPITSSSSGSAGSRKRCCRASRRPICPRPSTSPATSCSSPTVSAKMGSGAVASRLALSTFAHLAVHFGHWNVRVDARTAADIIDQYEAAYGRLNDAVIQRARAHPELSSMATTLDRGLQRGRRTLPHPRRQLTGVSVPRRSPHADVERPDGGAAHEREQRARVGRARDRRPPAHPDRDDWRPQPAGREFRSSISGCGTAIAC